MKMKLNIVDKEGKKVSDFEVSLKGDIRDDIFKRAVLGEESLFRQPYGHSPTAGRRASINVSKRRKALRSTYGKGGSRTPRKSMWSRGVQFRFVGAFSPNTVGGRRAHGPTADKNFVKVVNNKEWLLALKSGFLASLDTNLIKANGQRVPQEYPFILDETIETSLVKTKDVKSLMTALKLDEEIERISLRKVRAGKGKMRSRTYKGKRGPLFVVSSLEAPLFKSLRNIKGVDVMTADVLMAADFGMSELPGRMVVFTKPAIETFMEVFN